jgi:hypothetical protein
MAGGGDGQVRDFGVDDNRSDHDSNLSEIMHLVDMQFGITSEGWNTETARLYAIDIAMLVLRRNVLVLAEVDRQTLTYQLQEARTLVVGGRDRELGFLQAALESHLNLARGPQERRLWLAAIDALLPNPYRAALVSTKNALCEDTDALAEFSNLLRDRLLARLGEGSLNSEPGDTLFLTA